MALNLLGLLSHSHGGVLISSPVNMNFIISTLHSSLNDTSSNGRIMLASLRALSFIISSISLESDIEPFQHLIEPMINGLSTMIASHLQASHIVSESMVISYIDILIELIESKVAFIEFKLVYVVESLLALGSTASVSPSIRRMLVETIVTIGLLTPKKLRKIKSRGANSIIERIVTICIEMMGQIPDEASWESATNHEEGNAISSSDDQIVEAALNADCGESSLDRLLPVLGINCTSQTMNQAINSLLQASPEVWRYNYVGFRVLGIYIDASARMTKSAEITRFVQRCIQIFENFMVPINFHPLHPRVKGSMFLAISRLIFVHGKFIFADYESLAYGVKKDNALISSMTLMLQFLLAKSSVSSIASPRIRCSVLDCLMKLIDVSPRLFLDDKAHAILNTVIQSLSEGPRIVQELAVLCIISLSDTIRGDPSASNTITMAMYYDSLMPILKSVLAQCHVSGGYEELWSQTFECCAIVGEASGIEKFYNDAIEMMNTLIRHYQVKDENISMNKHFMKAWIRIT
jgi:hypothetical protein